MDGNVVAEFEKNGKEMVRVSLTEYQSHKLIDIRVFYRGAAGELLPGKGIALKRELITTLRKALQEAEKQNKVDAAPSSDEV